MRKTAKKKSVSKERDAIPASKTTIVKKSRTRSASVETSQKKSVVKLPQQRLKKGSTATESIDDLINVENNNINDDLFANELNEEEPQQLQQQQIMTPQMSKLNLGNTTENVTNSGPNDMFTELLLKTPKAPAFDEKTKLKSTNQVLLRTQKPGLLMRQTEFMNGSKEERRKNYIKSVFVELNNIPTWTEFAPKLLAETQAKKNAINTKSPNKKKKGFFSKSEENKNPTKINYPDPLYEYNTAINDKISIYRGGLEVLEVDAVVISAGKSLQKTNMAKSIFENAGSELEEEVNVYKHNQHLNTESLKNCEAVVFAGYRLPALYTIHSVWQGSGRSEYKLEDSYANALYKAVEFNLRSIAFPCLGTGGYGFPHDKGCKSALNAVRKWMDKNSGKIDRIIFCCYTEADLNEYKVQTFAYFPIKQTPLAAHINMGQYFGVESHGFDPVVMKQLCDDVQNAGTLDFSSCGQWISDFAFWILHILKGVDAYSKVRAINCIGCNKVTDAAIYAIADSFDGLTELNVTGCPLVTDDALSQVLLTNPNCVLKYIGCNAPLLPQFLSSRLNKFKLKPCSTFKVIFLRTFSMQYKTPSLISQMIGKVGNDSGVSQPWRGVFRFESKVTNDGSKVNLYEIDASLLEFVGTERSVIVLPALGDAQEGVSIRKLLATAVIHGKGTPIICLSTGAEKLLKSWEERVSRRVREDVIQKMAMLTWHDSLTAANLCAFQLWLNRCKLINVKPGDIANLNSKGWKTAFEHVNIHSQYMDAIDIEQLNKMTEQIKDQSLASIDSLIYKQALIRTGSIIRITNSQYALNMESHGQLLNEVLNCMCVEKGNTNGREKLIPWLDSSAMALSLKKFELNLMEKLGITKPECEKFVDALAHAGFFYGISYPWMNAHTRRPVVIPSSTFEKEPAVSIESIWGEAWEDDESELVLVYSLVHHPSAVFMHNLVRRLLTFTLPVVVWSDGIICQISCHEILIRLTNSASDSEGFSLIAGVRGMNFRESSDKKKAEAHPKKVWEDYEGEIFQIVQLSKSLGEIFQIVRQVVDVTLIESKCYASSQLRCPYCRVKDRRHYYDVQKVVSKPEDPIKCNTFRENVPVGQLYLDGYFSDNCNHYSKQDDDDGDIRSPQFGDKCTMCWAEFTSEIEYRTGGKSCRDSACHNCFMCQNCITTLKTDAGLLFPGLQSSSVLQPQLKTDKSKQTQAQQSEAQGFECSCCAFKLPNRKTLAEHQIAWCPYRLRKLIGGRLKDEDVKPESNGRMFTVKCIPKIVQICLYKCSSVDLIAVGNIGGISFRTSRDEFMSWSSMANVGEKLTISLVRYFNRHGASYVIDGVEKNLCPLKDDFCFITILLWQAKSSIMVIPSNENIMPMVYPLARKMYAEIMLDDDHSNDSNVDKVSKKKGKPSKKDEVVEAKCYIGELESFDSDGELIFSFTENYTLNEDISVDHFQGYINDPKVHPIGWATKHGAQFVLPTEDQKSDQPFDIIRFLDRRSASQIPQSFFSISQYPMASNPITDFFTRYESENVKIKWRVGMKLEALDRKNPNLTCVATVQAMMGVSRVEIYFDGWSHNFDYTCDITNKDMHPIGFCASRGSSLQPPKGYAKGLFLWEEYLRETSSEPVPFECFTQEQIGGTSRHSVYRQRDLLRGKQEGKEKLATNFDQPSTENQPLLPHLIRFHKQYLCTRDAFMQVSDAEILTPMIPHLVPLPADLTREKLEFPSRRVALDWSLGKQTLHGLCIHLDTDSENIERIGTIQKMDMDPQGWDIMDRFLQDYGSFIHLGDVSIKLDQLSLQSLYQTVITTENVISCTRSGNIPLYTTKYKPSPLENIHSLYEKAYGSLVESIRALIHSKLSLDLITDLNIQNNTLSSEQVLESLHRYLYLNFANLHLLARGSGKKSKRLPTSARFKLLLIQWLAGADKDAEPSRLSCTRCSLKLPTTESLQHIINTYNNNNGTVNAALAISNPHLFRVAYLYEPDWDFGVMRACMDKLPKETTFPNLTVIAFCKNSTTSVESQAELLKRLIKMSPNLKVVVIESLIMEDARTSASVLFFPHLQDSLLMLSVYMRLDNTWEILTKLQSLHLLNLKQCGISTIPDSIGQLRELEFLSLAENPISTVPSKISQLKALTYLNMSAVPLLKLSNIVTMNTIIQTLTKCNLPIILHKSREELEDAISKGISKRISNTTPIEKQEDLDEINRFIRVHAQTITTESKKTNLEPICELERLKHLMLKDQDFVKIPMNIQQLHNLETLVLTNNARLITINQFAGTLTKLKTINLDGCYSLRTPPPEVVRRGTESVIAYLKRLMTGFQECKRTKLMLVGLGGAGKTRYNDKYDY